MSSSDYSDSTHSHSSIEKIDFAGIIIFGKYVLITELGSGSFATVWLSYNLKNSNFYAIKIQNPEDYQAGEAEVIVFNAMKTDKCPYINQLIEHFIHKSDYGEHICMVFELMAGNVYDLVKKGKYKNGLPFKICKQIMYQVLAAMDIFNVKYKKLHSDIKPDNVLIVGRSIRVQKIIDLFLTNIKKERITHNKNLNKVFNLVNKLKPDIEALESDELVHENYLENIKVKLSDFGNVCDIDHTYFDIQTRYYRSPEIILEYKYNETSDIWSAACLFYEILTGEMLFDPNKDPKFDRDRHHLYDMQSILGKIPLNILQTANRTKFFFKNNGLLKGREMLEYRPLSLELINKLEGREDVTENDTICILDILYKMLDYDPFKRPLPKDCLKHKLLSSMA